MSLAMKTALAELCELNFRQLPKNSCHSIVCPLVGTVYEALLQIG